MKLCDKCKKPGQDMHIIKMNVISSDDEESFDLCSECFRKLYKSLSGMNISDAEAENKRRGL
jgi:hypothetical protein